jgi:hypothetical protein
MEWGSAESVGKLTLVSLACKQLLQSLVRACSQERSCLEKDLPVAAPALLGGCVVQERRSCHVPLLCRCRNSCHTHSLHCCPHPVSHRSGRQDDTSKERAGGLHKSSRKLGWRPQNQEQGRGRGVRGQG